MSQQLVCSFISSGKEFSGQFEFEDCRTWFNLSHFEGSPRQCSIVSDTVAITTPPQKCIFCDWEKYKLSVNYNTDKDAFE